MNSLRHIFFEPSMYDIYGVMIRKINPNKFTSFMIELECGVGIPLHDVLWGTREELGEIIEDGR